MKKKLRASLAVPVLFLVAVLVIAGVGCACGSSADPSAAPVERGDVRRRQRSRRPTTGATAPGDADRRRPATRRPATQAVADRAR